MNLFQQLKESARKESLNEISQQAKIQKAIDIATSMGGNMTGAVKRIEQIKKGLSKNKNVANALRLANEETISEDYKKVIKMFPRDNDWKKLITKHRRAIDDFRNNNKDLPSKVEDELLTWASQTGEVSGKHDAEDFIMSILDESTISENYRKLAKHGMGTETPKSVKVGTEIDYYQKDGAKYMGKVVKMDKQSYTVKDDKTSKTHKFFYHDRIKAAKLLKQGDNIQEKVEYAEYKFRNKGDAQKALNYFKSQQLIKLDINDDGLSQGELAIDAGKKDMTKQHKEVLKNFKPKVLTTEQTISEGTWAVPDSYPKLVALQKFLRKPHKAKTAKDVEKFTNDVYSFFGDDSFFDALGAYGTTLPGGEKDEDGKPHSAEYLKRANQYNKIKKGTDLNLVLIKQLGDWTGNVLKFKGVEMVQFPRDWYLKDNPKHKDDDAQIKAKLESVQEGKGMKRGRGNLKFKRQDSIKAEAVSSDQQAAIAIAKKKKNESVMDAYREMWEENLKEEMITYRVKGMQRPEEDKFKKSAKMMGLKITMDKGRDDTVIVMSGTKKKLRDFDSVARGKSSYGDPSTIKHFDEK